MFRVRIFVIGLCGALVGSLLSLGPAQAQVPTPKVSLRASRNLITFGGKVELRGRISPRLENQEVTILSDGGVIATATTDVEGRYAVRIQPPRNRTVYAQWATAVSDRERIRVRPIVNVSLSNVRLFTKARLKGSVKPAVKTEKITVALKAGNRTVARKRLDLRNGKRFSTRIPVRWVETVRAVARIDPEGFAPGVDASRRRSVATPYLSEGDRGPLVKLVERRLMRLGYRLDDVNGYFNFTTSDALLAFHKVQGLPRITGTASYTWRALLDPERPEPVSKRGYHFEVDQTKQVLYIVRKGKIRTIVHVSTGAGGATRDGVWSVWSQLDGYSPKRLYFPSFFDGERGIHGWPDVPTYPASHGCVRTPMWIAPWLNDKAYVGMTVRVYHS